MPAGGNGATYFAGSVFGPDTYAPCPVMMFRETFGTGQELDVVAVVLVGGNCWRTVQC